MNDEPIGIEFRVIDQRTGEPLWAINPSPSVVSAIATAITLRPKCLLVHFGPPWDGDASKVEPITDVTRAKRTIHALIFDTHVRSLM